MTFDTIETRKYEEMTPTKTVVFRSSEWSSPASSEQNSRSSIPAVSEKTPSRTKTPETHHHQDGTTTSSPEEDLAATPTLQRPAQDRTRPAPPARLGRQPPPPPDEDHRTPDPPLARHRRRSQPLKTHSGKRASRRRTPAPEHAAASTPRRERRAPNHLSARSRCHCCVVVWIDSND